MNARTRWFLDCQDIGCIVCYLRGYPGTPGDMHHIHRNGRRVDDMHTICLCVRHHRNGTADDPARHPTKRAFEAKNGTEWELWGLTKKLIADRKAA